MCDVAMLCALRDMSGCSPGTEAELVVVLVPLCWPIFGLQGLALMDDVLVRTHMAGLNLVLHKQATVIGHTVVSAYLA